MIPAWLDALSDIEVEVRLIQRGVDQATAVDLRRRRDDPEVAAELVALLDGSRT